MSDLDRLLEIIGGLPPQQIQALLVLLAPLRQVRDEEFARRLADAPEEELDQVTAEGILAAAAEPGELISHGELKLRLGH